MLKFWRTPGASTHHITLNEKPSQLGCNADQPCNLVSGQSYRGGGGEYNSCEFINSCGETVAFATKQGRLYCLEFLRKSQESVN